MATTITRRIAKRGRQPRLYFSTSVLGLAVLAAIFISAWTGSGDQSGPRPNLSLNIGGVTCAQALDATHEFTAAVKNASHIPPDYQGVQAFGFTPPVNPGDIEPFQALLQARQNQLGQKAESVSAGTCTDNPTASVVDADGKSVTLPVVIGDQPDQPITGSESNQDVRTVPVTIGANGDKNRTNTWSELNNLFGNQRWYTSCTDSNLDMHWSTDVPKFMATESKHDNRFILAVNVSDKLTDDQIRQKAASDGNPRVDKLPIVRTPSIINTRHLDKNRCDPFIDARSMVRVTLGKVVLDGKGNFKKLEQDKGAFVDCHNLWRLPKSTPVPTPTPTPGTPGTTPPPPHTTPPPHPKCTPPLFENEHGKCIEKKDRNQGVDEQGNNPAQNQGSVGSDPKEPRPSDPPTSYRPPPPAQTTQPAPPRTTPPPETSAPQPSDPATGCVPPPGMTTC